MNKIISNYVGKLHLKTTLSEIRIYVMYFENRYVRTRTAIHNAIDVPITDKYHSAMNVSVGL